MKLLAQFVLIVLLSGFTEVRGMTVLSYTKNNFTIQFQRRPWSLPTSKVTPAVLARLRTLTKAYAVFVWNDVSGALMVARDGDDMNALMDDARTEIKARQGDTVPKYVPGKTKIRNGKIVP